MGLITLNNKDIDPVIWEDAKVCRFNLYKHVHIWRISVSSHLAHLENMLRVLNPGEIIRANKYLKELDRNRFIVSRSTLRHILAGYLKCAPESIEFKSGENEKPYLESPIRFNLSHSGDWIVIAVANTEVGIDVEYIKPHFNYEGILNSHFNEQEMNYINADDGLHRFFKFWTRKEAILKATGIGLTEYLMAITALDGIHKIDGDLLHTQTDWELNTFKTADNYPATIAAGLLIEKYYFYNTDYKYLLECFTLPMKSSLH